MLYIDGAIVTSCVLDTYAGCMLCRGFLPEVWDRCR